MRTKTKPNCLLHLPYNGDTTFMSAKIQTDLVGYFGFPNDEEPPLLSASRSKSSSNKKQCKRRAVVSSDNGQTSTTADCNEHSNKKKDDGVGDDSSKSDASKVALDETYEDERSTKRARVSLDNEEPDESKPHDGTLEEITDDDKPINWILNAAELKQQRIDRHLQKRIAANPSIFSIHSALYTKSTHLSNMRHASRLLRGKGTTTNVLSQLFQRSVQPYSRKTRDMSSYSHSGQHWNTCPTVELDTTRIMGEVSSMAFDTDGVLLATGDDGGYVRIYDFDDVSALDVRKRNERGRLKNTKVEEDNRATELALNEESSDTVVIDQDEKGNDLPRVNPAMSKPILSFRCTSYRITDLQWNPNNQDQLVVSFAQSPDIHLYDVASSKTPLPRITIGTSNNSSTKGREGISVMRFIPSPLPKQKSTQILTGGSRGTVRLWLIPRPKRGQVIEDIRARCVWSVDLSNTEGCSGLLVLPSANNNVASEKPLILISGGAGSLTLLNTRKCTRKTFSTTATPKIESKWDLYNMTLRELRRLGNNTNMPARRWMGVNQIGLLDCSCTQGSSSYRISVVLNCGWVLSVYLTVSSPDNLVELSGSHTYNSSIRVQIIHITSRVQCFNSSNEKMTVLGGMALNCSLPDIPIPSSLSIKSLKQMIWVGDVKQKTYTMPSKDKFVLCEQHGTITTNANSNKESRNLGDGLILLDATPELNVSRSSTKSKESPTGDNVHAFEANQKRTLARLPLNGTPLSIAVHPAGEWMVVSYGLNGRRSEMRSVELVNIRKRPA